MNDGKRICCFTEKWGSGGIESFLLSVFENIDRSGLEIELVTTQLESELYLPRLEKCGVPLTVLSGRTRRVGRNHALFRSLLRERDYSAVHLNIYHALSLLYARDAWRAGVPVRIAHSHNNGLRKSLLRPAKLMIHRAARAGLSSFSTARAACSRMAAEFMFPAGAETVIVPNGIRLDRFSFDGAARARVRAELRAEDRFILGSVGRLCEQKNQMFLLDVTASLARRRADAVLLLVGEGDMRGALESRAAALGISDRVIFYGTSEDVPSLLCAMDCFALPSLFEGLGIAAIEAQAAGLPVLCSEFVPEEALASPLARRLELSAGAAAWAEAAVEAGIGERISAAETLRAAGYDIADTAARMRRLFLGEEMP